MGVLQHWQHLPGPAEPLKSQGNKDSSQSVQNQHWRDLQSQVITGAGKAAWRAAQVETRLGRGCQARHWHSCAQENKPSTFPSGTTTKTTSDVCPHPAPLLLSCRALDGHKTPWIGVKRG